MKLKTKLMITFATVLMLPVLLTAVCLGILQQTGLNTLQELYQTETIWEVFVGGSVQALNGMTEAVQNEILELIDEDADLLLDEERLKSYSEALSEQDGYLVLIKSDEIYYQGETEDEVAGGQLLEQLLSLGDGLEFADGGVYMAGELHCFIKQQAVQFSDGSSGQIYLMIRVGTVLPQLKRILLQMAVAVICVLILVAFTLTMWIYYTMLRPISALMKATEEIKEGNLDYAMDLEERDELGALCSNFEEMRLRLKKTSEEKLQYDRENKELISNISHDLKTPITAIKGYSEGILDGLASSPEKLDRYVRTIYNKACDMERLIEELTFYTKIDTNKIPYVFSKINVADYFSDCVADLGDELAAENISFQYRNRVDDDTLIIADAEQLKRVINNIISNSVKYMDKTEPFIHVDLFDAGDFIQVSIEDNGRGIGSQELTHIFERFYRTDSSRNSSKGGSGIGLSIVRKIIEDHGGKIWATSVEKKGTTMNFVLRKYDDTET